MQKLGAVVFDYGNNLRGQALAAGEEHAMDFLGFVPAYIRPLFCRGKGPFRWVALSGDPEDIYRTDEAILELFPANAALKRWISMARQKIQFQGLPARICWLGYGERDKAGLAFNELIARGIVADGTPEAAGRLSRVLMNDPGTGVMRHVDAGYEEALECAKEFGIKIPMI